MQVTTLDTLFVTRCSACVGGDVVRGKELLLSLSYPGLLGAGDPEGFRNSSLVQRALAMLRQADKRLSAVVMASYSTSIVISRSLLAASGCQILKVYENVTGQRMTM
jgi:hypothetical protein